MARRCAHGDIDTISFTPFYSVRRYPGDYAFHHPSFQTIFSFPVLQIKCQSFSNNSIPLYPSSLPKLLGRIILPPPMRRPHLLQPLHIPKHCHDPRPPLQITPPPLRRPPAPSSATPHRRKKREMEKKEALTPPAPSTHPPHSPQTPARTSSPVPSPPAPSPTPPRTRPVPSSSTPATILHRPRRASR